MTRNFRTRHVHPRIVALATAAALCSAPIAFAGEGDAGQVTQANHIISGEGITDHTNRGREQVVHLRIERIPLIGMFSHEA